MRENYFLSFELFPDEMCYLLLLLHLSSVFQKYLYVWPTIDSMMRLSRSGSSLSKTNPGKWLYFGKMFIDKCKRLRIRISF